MATLIYCFNQSTVLKSSDMFLMINAINIMLPAFCTTWSIKQYKCVAAPANIKPGNAMYCAFLDNSKTANTLAYHTEFANVPYGDVFVKTILNYGGAILMGANNTIPTVAQAFSHEIFEMLINQNVNVWWQQSSGSLVPAEVCDPVQGAIVSVKVGSVTVGLSDYVYPVWSDPQSTKGPYNFLNTLTRPFQVSNGGYVITMTNGKIANVFGTTISPYIEYRAQNIINYMNMKFPPETVVEPVVAPIVAPVVAPIVAPIVAPSAGPSVAPLD